MMKDISGASPQYLSHPIMNPLEWNRSGIRKWIRTTPVIQHVRWSHNIQARDRFDDDGRQIQFNRLQMHWRQRLHQHSADGKLSIVKYIMIQAGWTIQNLSHTRCWGQREWQSGRWSWCWWYSLRQGQRAKGLWVGWRRRKEDRCLFVNFLREIWAKTNWESCCCPTRRGCRLSCGQWLLHIWYHSSIGEWLKRAFSVWV